MSAIIEIKDLHKRYGKLEAVKGISFEVERGAFLAFLGPNGAGKSTTINCLSTVLEFDSGEIIVAGHRVGEQDINIRRDIGVVFQNGVLDNLLTVKENAAIRAALYGIDSKTFETRYARIAEQVDLTSFSNQRYGKLSGGQKRRADIARALVHEPKILILDEPTSGLDPQSRRKIWDTVNALQRELNLTVFLTTHYMEEAELASDVIIVDHGVIAARGTPESLKNAYSKDKLKIEPKSVDEFCAFLDKKNVKYLLKNDEVVIELDSTLSALDRLKEYERFIKSFEVIKSSMDSVFLEITGFDIR